MKPDTTTMDKFYVIDTEKNLTSYSEKKDAAECFKTEALALKRAKELAASEPGQIFYVCKAIAAVACPVGKAEVTK